MVTLFCSLSTRGFSAPTSCSRSRRMFSASPSNTYIWSTRSRSRSCARFIRRAHTTQIPHIATLKSNRISSTSRLCWFSHRQPRPWKTESPPALAAAYSQRFPLLDMAVSQQAVMPAQQGQQSDPQFHRCSTVAVKSRCAAVRSAACLVSVCRFGGGDGAPAEVVTREAARRYERDSSTRYGTGPHRPARRCTRYGYTKRQMERGRERAMTTTNGGETKRHGLPAWVFRFFLLAYYLRRCHTRSSTAPCLWASATIITYWLPKVKPPVLLGASLVKSTRDSDARH